MQKRRNFRMLLALTLSLPLFSTAEAQSLAAYLESSGTEQKPRSNVGFAVRADRLQLRAGIALKGVAIPDDPDQAHRGSTEVVPTLRSAFAVAENLDLETKVSLPEWNAGTDAALDTRLHYKKSIDAFFNELDGSLWRSPQGFTKQMLRLGFHHLLGDAFAGTPLTITGAAIFEATQAASASRKLGVETRVTGLLSRFLTSDHSLSFKVEKTVGARSESASTLAYDQSWSLSSPTSLGLSLKFLRRSYGPADYEPSIDFSWHGRL